MLRVISLKSDNNTARGCHTQTSAQVPRVAKKAGSGGGGDDATSSVADHYQSDIERMLDLSNIRATVMDRTRASMEIAKDYKDSFDK